MYELLQEVSVTCTYKIFPGAFVQADLATDVLTAGTSGADVVVHAVNELTLQTGIFPDVTHEKEYMGRAAQGLTDYGTNTPSYNDGGIWQVRLNAHQIQSSPVLSTFSK